MSKKSRQQGPIADDKNRTVLRVRFVEAPPENPPPPVKVVTSEERPLAEAAHAAPSTAFGASRDELLRPIPGTNKMAVDPETMARLRSRINAAKPLVKTRRRSKGLPRTRSKPEGSES